MFVGSGKFTGKHFKNMVIIIQRLVKGFRIGPRMTVDEVFRSSAYPRAPMVAPAHKRGGHHGGGRRGRKDLSKYSFQSVEWDYLYPEDVYFNAF